MKNLKAWVKSYTLQMAFAFVVYALGLFVSQSMDYYFHHTPYKYISLLPVFLSMVWMVVVILKHVFKADEMWRKSLTEGMAFAGLATAFTCFSLLFLRDLGLKFQAEDGFYLYWVYFTLGIFFSARRFG